MHKKEGSKVSSRACEFCCVNWKEKKALLVFKPTGWVKLE